MICSRGATLSGRRFAILDVRRGTLSGRPRNVEGTWFKTEQPAALMEGRTGKHVISSVGVYSVPTVNAYVAGFRAGAKKADPRVVTLNGYSHDFSNASKCERAAQSQIAMG